MARDTAKDLMLLSKETLVALLQTAVKNGNFLEMELRKFEDRERTAEDLSTFIESGSQKLLM